MFSECPDFSHSVIVGALGKYTVSGSDCRPVRLSLFRTTFQLWNNIFLSQHFSISIIISQISVSANRVIIRSSWRRIQSKLLWSCIPWWILCVEHLGPICYIEAIKGVSKKFIASSHCPLHIFEWSILSTNMFSFILLNKFRNNLILFFIVIFSLSW